MWIKSDQKDALELIERSDMSAKGFGRLRGIIEGKLEDLVAMGLVKQLGPLPPSLRFRPPANSIYMRAPPYPPHVLSYNLQ